MHRIAYRLIGALALLAFAVAPAAALKISQTAGGSMISNLCSLGNSGTIVIYSGTQPTNPDTALSGNTALATFTFSSAACGSASHVSSNEQVSGSFSASTVTASATGTATFARMFESNGTTVVGDFSVGTSGSDIDLNSTSITSGGNVTLSSFVLNEPVD
jgi:hypothetical protein